MRYSHTFFYLQSRIGNEPPKIIEHSKNEESGELLFRFLNHKKAYDLMKEKKITNPECQYRIVKEIIVFHEGAWS